MKKALIGIAFAVTFLFSDTNINIVKIKADTIQDWVKINKIAIAKLIENQKDIKKQLEKISAAKKSNKYIVKTYMANVRAKPNINSKIVGALKNGVVLNINNFINGWGQISPNSFISKEVLLKIGK